MRGKRIALLTGVLLLLAGAVWCLWFPVKTPDMGSQVLTAKKAGKVIKNLVPASEELLEGLTFAGEEIPEDVESGIFYLPVNMDETDWETGRLRSGFWIILWRTRSRRL